MGKSTGKRVQASGSNEAAVIGAAVYWLAFGAEARRRVAGLMVIFQMGGRWWRRIEIQGRCGMDERRCLRALADLRDCGVVTRMKIARSANEERPGLQYAYTLASGFGVPSTDRLRSVAVASIPRRSKPLESIVRMVERIRADIQRRPRQAAKQVQQVHRELTLLLGSQEGR